MALIKQHTLSSSLAWTPPLSQYSAPAKRVQHAATNNHKAPNFSHFRLSLLPWLLGLILLGVYVLTLNYWVSPDSLGVVASLTGMIWGQEHLEPVTYLVTLPLRCLPVSWMPPVLNVVSALCAALTLVLLARTVSLLPHKIFKRNFKPCRNQPTLIKSRYAWVPPLLAVVVCGLQYNFWENAINATGSMINLLMFAYVVRCFPEYSASQKNSWLLRGAFVYGLALANDATMAVFLPAILIALFWVKRLHIFEVTFVSRLLRTPWTFNLLLLVLIPGCWLAGLAVIFAKPLLANLTQPGHLSLRAALKTAVKNQLATAFQTPDFLLVTGLVTLIPLVYLMLRYYHSLTALKRLNPFLPRIIYHLIFAFFGVTCLWLMLDSPLSPRRLELGLAVLPLYYLAALSAGYFAGHFVRITEIKPERGQKPGRRRPSARQSKHQEMDGVDFLKRTLATVAALLAVAAPALLVYKNLPVILQTRNGPVNEYFALLAASLPAGGAVVIGNDLFLQDYAEASVMRAGRQASFLFINADAMVKNADYQAFLQQRHPELKLDRLATGMMQATNREMAAVNLLQTLAQTRPVFCLQPAAVFEDYLGQYFYPQSAGLVYRLQPYPATARIIKPIAANPDPAGENFWQNFESREYAGLATRLHPAHLGISASAWDKTLAFHPELDQQLVQAGNFYAAALNNRGVELQKRGRFTAAGVCFGQARELNPTNSAAQINGQFNQDYLAHKPTLLRSPKEEDANLTDFRDWKHVARDGLVDEPNFCNLLGQVLATAHLYRPAIEQFERVKKLAPNEVLPIVNLAVAYFDGNDYATAAGEAGQVIASDPTNQTALFIKGIASAQLGACEQGIAALTDLLALQPNYGLARLNRAACYLQTGRLEAARRDYELVAKTLPESYSAYYSLAEIAFRNQDKANAIKNYRLFLKYAPSNHPQIELAETRLKVLSTIPH